MLKDYVLGIVHMSITGVILFVLLFLSFFTGLGFVAAISGLINILTYAMVFIATITSLYIIKVRLKKLINKYRFIFSSSILPLFLSIWFALVEYFGFGIISAIIELVPVLVYVSATYLLTRYFIRLQ